MYSLGYTTGIVDLLCVHICTPRKYVYNYSDLEIACHWLLAPPMLLQCGLNYSPSSTEWINVYDKHICGNILILWNRLFMISTLDKKIHANWKQPTL